MKGKSLSRVRLLATPWTAAYQALPSMGFSRQEYWSGVPLPSPTLPLSFATREENSLPKWAGKAAGFSSQIYTALTLAIWNQLEKKQGSLKMARFLLALPMPCKYWRSSSVGDSLSPWISHSFRGPEQGSIFKSFQHSSWLWPKNTKTELLEFFHGGCLIHIGNLLFLMQPLLVLCCFFFFMKNLTKAKEGHGRHSWQNPKA